ncbi:unnamed protein product [Adineta steineri]|uniref:Purple acid phosphatase n=1 Tax=Adineta steineri TaxID=433720 RepID=A0A819DQU9_9BILA|nr:unnamed protein product [Adineta steineri]
MLLVTALLVVLATSAFGQHQLNVRDNGKLCSQWIAITGGQVSLSYAQNQECATQVGIEQSGMNVRLCCQAVATTTSSSVFPRECGKQKYQPSSAHRIVGGVQAHPNSWPWQVRLQAGNSLCGGSLIDTRHVLTAAHCLKIPIVAQEYKVFVGLHDINQPIYGEQQIVAERVFMHEQYNKNTQENDIAIIRLSKPVTISDKINVICLPGSEANNVNETVWTSGWGTTSFQGETSPVLKQTALHTMPNRCGQIYGNYNNQKQMCAGAYGGGRDTCQGDSGGPLMYESNGQWFLNGVVSYGHECARDGYPGVYARVSYYVPWINTNDAPSPYTCNRSIGEPSIIRDEITLNVTATVYSSLEQINVTWIPIFTPCIDDFIGIYFTEIPFNKACDYFDYEFIKNQENLISWQMINLRRSLEFRYYSRDHNCSGNYSFIGKSAIIQPLNINEPTHIHLAYGDRIDEMFISYLTNSSEYIPQCQYGFHPSLLNFSKNGSTITYKASDMCEERANISGPQNFIDPGYMHTILLQDLRPLTTYYYRVGTDEHGWSSIYSFTNRPANSNEEVYLIAYGDMGLSPVEPGAKLTIDHVKTLVQSANITCLLHIGDISYARGIGALWDAFMTQIQPIAARIPYMVGIGNHEYDHVTGGEHDPSGAPGPGGFHPTWGNYGQDSGGECAVPMVHRFHSPSNGNGLFWYSFNVGPLHILYYSTEHDFQQSSVQYNWIEHDLQSVNRSLTPWIIIGSHRPMYTSQLNYPDLKIGAMLQLHLEPLFYKYHVDVNLFAHLHAYERSCPMYQGKCVQDGITNVLIGMAGQDLTILPYSTQEWSQYHDAQYGYTTIFANKTYLHLIYYHNDDNKIADEFILQK